MVVQKHQNLCRSMRPAIGEIFKTCSHDALCCSILKSIQIKPFRINRQLIPQSGQQPRFTALQVVMHADSWLSRNEVRTRDTLTTQATCSLLEVPRTRSQERQYLRELQEARQRPTYVPGAHHVMRMLSTCTVGTCETHEVAVFSTS